jgi:hypothetical protein
MSDITPNRRSILAFGALAAVTPPRWGRVFDDPPQAAAEPVVDGPWVRPAQQKNAEPIWGLAEGLRVGLWPTPGPRGLIRIYAPYLGQTRHRVINFVAIEPVVRGRRGLSELEPSSSDGKAGKLIVSSDEPFAPEEHHATARAANGVVHTSNGRQRLSVSFALESFENGARPIVQATFRPEQRYEVEFRVFSQRGGSAMASCILTATMGNFARLRRVWLRDKVVEARDVWPRFQPDQLGFAPHATWRVAELRTREGEALVAATSDEVDPATARYDRDVAAGWYYVGKPATQYWRAAAEPGLVVRANARQVYWASRARIPNGLAIENFEMEAPFHEGQSFTFGVDPRRPSDLGWNAPTGSIPSHR